jgi:hypothetical protein
MTVAPGAPWGTEVPRPDGLRVAVDDRAAALAVTDGTDRPVALGGGDLLRTVGGRPPDGRSRLLRLPVDLLHVELDDGTTAAALAHVVARSPRRRGSWWRGEVVVVMNAEFLGPLDVAPRGHPNDGRAEALWCGPELGWRQRLAAARRARRAAHLPHPSIHTRSIRRRSWELRRPLDVHVDGVRIGRTSALTVSVRPDAGHVLV